LSEEDTSQSLTSADRQHWLLGDEQGSVRDIADIDGSNVLDHIKYDSFGNVVSQTHSTVALRFRLHEPGTRCRERSDVLQRPLLRPGDGPVHQPGPSGFAAGDGNLYRYVGNSTPNAEDPTGMVLGESKPERI